jgi:uncharacterized protein YbaR (Trm112 family)
MTAHTPDQALAGAIDPKLLETVVCPLTKGPLGYDIDNQELVSRRAKLAFPIRAGILIMLPKEVRGVRGLSPRCDLQHSSDLHAAPITWR